MVNQPKRQIGSSHGPTDQRFSANAPGKRTSASGNIYYERRKNRSDVAGQGRKDRRR